MSTRVGTLQAPKAGGSILLAAFLASLVMLTIAVVAISIDRDQGRQGETTLVGHSLVYGPVEDNTPSELSAGTVGGTAANTPSELKPVYMHGRNLRGLSPLSGTNTPSELTGGDTGRIPAEIYDRHQRG